MATDDCGSDMDAEGELDIAFGAGDAPSQPTHEPGRFDRKIAGLFVEFKQTSTGLDIENDGKLACPFAIFCPKYQRIDGGSCIGPGFPTIARLNQHIDREHLYLAEDKASKPKFNRPRLSKERSELWVKMHSIAHAEGQAQRNRNKASRNENKNKWWEIASFIFGWDRPPVEPSDVRHLVLPGPKLEQVVAFVRHVFQSRDPSIVNLMTNLTLGNNAGKTVDDLDDGLDAPGQGSALNQNFASTTGEYIPQKQDVNDSGCGTMEPDQEHATTAASAPAEQDVYMEQAGDGNGDDLLMLDRVQTPLHYDPYPPSLSDRDFDWTSESQSSGSRRSTSNQSPRRR